MVAAPLLLCALERASMPDRDHRVLEQRPPPVVRVHVARDDGLHADRLRQLSQPVVATRVASLVGPLELDEEAVPPEDSGQLGCAVRIPDREPVPRAAREADQPFMVCREQVPVEARRDRLRRLGPSVRMCCGQESAEIRVSPRRLDEQRDVRTIGERHLRAGDRPHAERLRRVRELERAVDAVVVGERERLVAELRRPRGELLRVRSAVEERIG